MRRGGDRPSASLLLFSLGLVLLYFTSGSTVGLVEGQVLLLLLEIYACSSPLCLPCQFVVINSQMMNWIGLDLSWCVGNNDLQKTWCIAKPSASNEILAQNLDYACSQVSCAVIQKGGPCYYPDSLVSRAAVAMNLYYAYSGRHAWNCYFNSSALVVQSDPSTTPHQIHPVAAERRRL